MGVAESVLQITGLRGTVSKKLQAWLLLVPTESFLLELLVLSQVMA
jgi:hypothetical protein